jgi:hypothetical protein
MSRTAKALIALASVLVTLFCASTASAAIYKYSVSIDNGAYNPVVGGIVRVENLNSGIDSKVVVRSPAGAIKISTTKAASTFSNLGLVPGVAPGDLIDVYQPSGAGSPTESYVIPPVVLNVINGATALTGSVPPGFAVAVLTGDERCGTNPQPLKLGPGAFNVPYPKILPGETVYIYGVSPSGDTLNYTVNSPGETPCVLVDGGGKVAPAPGGGPGENPYALYVEHTLNYIAPSIRAVLRRGGSPIADVSADSTSVNTSFTTRPLPGDIVDVYRPKTAPAPTYSIAIPQISAKFDPAADLVAVDGPAAGIQRVSVCRQFSCGLSAERATIGTAAGRAFFNFAVAQGDEGPVDLRPTDVINTRFADADFKLVYIAQATVGDLVAPVTSFKLAKTLKFSALSKLARKGWKQKVTSNEVAAASLAFTFKKPKKKGSKKTSTVTLAKASGTLGVGTTSLKFKFSKSGKKTVKKWLAAGRRAKSVSATLTATFTDASGNVSTIAKSVKLKP